MTTEVKQKSVQLPKELKREFKAYVGTFRYVTDFVREHGIDRMTTYRIMNRRTKTVSPDTLEKITEILKNKKAA